MAQTVPPLRGRWGEGQSSVIFPDARLANELGAFFGIEVVSAELALSFRRPASEWVDMAIGASGLVAHRAIDPDQLAPITLGSFATHCLPPWILE